MPYLSYPPALLALEDGLCFKGFSFGSLGTATGEVCFNTAMTGYQEVITDPSYRGQIVAMTAPHIGNYGINDEDQESESPQINGFVVEEGSAIASNWRSQGRLQEYFQRYGVVAVGGIDTRALTRHLRVSGVMRSCLTTEEMPKEEAIALAKGSPFLEDLDLVGEVTTPEPYEWSFEGKRTVSWEQLQQREPGEKPLVAVYDFGIKKNILDLLLEQELRLLVLPAITAAKEVLAIQPAGVFLSNGPGDPSRLTAIHETIRQLAPHQPIFGICLGHQLIAHAFGATTFKLPFGHRGANHPVQDLRTQRILITSQNHGYAIDEDSLGKDLEVTFRHLNDHTIAGIVHRDLPIFSVQFHPEASPGPHEAASIFHEFRQSLKINS